MKKVLIVDDSRTIRQQVSAALTTAGFEVLEAEDGEAGLATIDGNQDLALVICDINMPRMTGIEMVTALSASGRITTLPVVMLTTEGRMDLMQKVKQAGAKGWLVKPVAPEQIVAVARKVARA